MDTHRIINTEGYRNEDLTPENQRHIVWLKYLIGDIEEQKAENADTKNSSLLEKLVNEIKRETIDEIVEFAEIQLEEYQISMIEEQE